MTSLFMCFICASAIEPGDPVLRTNGGGVGHLPCQVTRARKMYDALVPNRAESRGHAEVAIARAVQMFIDTEVFKTRMEIAREARRASRGWDSRHSGPPADS